MSKSNVEPSSRTSNGSVEVAPREQGSTVSEESLYLRLGGYDAVADVARDLLSHLMSDPQLERFWRDRGEDGIQREKQLLIDFFTASAGGETYYTGRDMRTAHRGMGID